MIIKRLYDLKMNSIKTDNLWEEEYLIKKIDIENNEKIVLGIDEAGRGPVIGINKKIIFRSNVIWMCILEIIISKRS